MADLATVADVEGALGRNLTEVEAARISHLLRTASATIRNHTGQLFTKVENDVRTFKVKRGKVRLPQRPVIAVTSVKDSNDNTLLFQFDGDDTLKTSTNLDPFSYVPWVNGIQAVTVTYSHGYEAIPDEIIGVMCSVVMRSLGREPVDAGITSETIAGYSYQVGAVGAAGAVGLLDSERKVLDTFKRRVTTPISLLGD